MDRDCREPATQSKACDVPVISNGSVHGQNVQINGGIFTSAGRDVHNHIYVQEPATSEAPKVDLISTLQSIDNFRGIQQDTFSRAAPETGAWIFKHQLFPVWRDPKGAVKTMWGSGIPGAGKTVLTSIVINGVSKWAKGQSSSVCIGYIYIRYNSHFSLTVRHCLQVLVKQTIEKHPGCLKLAEEVYAEHIRLATQPTEEELLELLRNFATVLAASFYFLDALDEAPPETQIDLVEKLSSTGAKLFITSRPSKTWEERFSNAHHFAITAQDSDLELLINNKLNSSQDLCKVMEQGGATLRAEIVASVKQKCGGMLLHASLQLAALQHCASVRDVRQTLSNFPPKIEDVYRDTWIRIVNQASSKGALAQNCLIWVLNAPKSMTVAELQRAAAICLETHKFDPDRIVHQDTLIALCRGLLVIDEETSLVHLVHYTAKETLERLILETFPRLHSFMASLCMGLLIQHRLQWWRDDDPASLEHVMKFDPVLPYAYDTWANFARRSLDDPSTAGQVKKFVRGCWSFPLPCGHSLDLLGPLHVAAVFNLPMSLAGTNLMISLNPNPRTRRQETPLHVACRHTSQFDAIKELLAFRFINVNATNNWKQTPLICACRAGNAGAARLLLGHPKVRLDPADLFGYRALQWAAFHDDTDLVKVILSLSQAEIHSVDKEGRTAVSRASEHGRFAMVKLLLSHSQSEARLGDNNGRTPLSWAAASKCIDSFKLILFHAHEDVHLADKHGRTPLSWASSHGQEEAVKILLDYPDTNVNRVDSSGRSPLSWASAECQEAAVKVLLTHPNIDVNVQDNEGQTPFQLSLASMHGARVAKLLLAHHQTNVNLKDREGRTLLISLAMQQRTPYSWFEDHVTAIARALLEHRQTDINWVDNMGWTALTWASKQGHTKLVEVLLKHPKIGDVCRADNQGETPLTWASKEGHKEIVELLLSHSHVKPEPYRTCCGLFDSAALKVRKDMD